MSPQAGNWLGRLADELARQWVLFRSCASCDGKISHTSVTCTVSMTGEELAEDLRNRPATIDSDFGKYDRSIHFLIKIMLLKMLILAHIYGQLAATTLLFLSTATMITELTKIMMSNAELAKHANKASIFAQMVAQTWYVIIRNPEFQCILYGKTFSGDWNTLIFNCILTAFFISLVPFLNDFTDWFARIMGDDTNNNLPFEMFDSCAHILSFIGMQLTGEERTEDYQTYNSQLLCIDKAGHAFLTPQTSDKVVKAFHVPFTHASANTTTIGDFQLMVIRNQNYVNNFSGDPIVKALTKISVEKYGIVKEFNHAKYAFQLADNPFKSTNIHTHEISDDSLSVLAEKVYNTDADNLLSIANQITSEKNERFDNLIRHSTPHIFNFYTDKTTSLFNTICA